MTLPRDKEEPEKRPVASSTASAPERTPEPDETWAIPTPGSTPLSKVRDKHPTDLPNCSKGNSSMRVPALFDAPTGPARSQTHRDPDAHELMSWCTWNSRRGDEITVSWKRYGSHPEKGTGAEQAKTYYEGFFSPSSGRREDVGVGEEALWVADDGTDASCLLDVRDVNLVVIVGVSGRAHPSGKCEELTTDLAGDALSAVPS